MYKIIIKGEAQTNYPHLSELDGIDCKDDFVEYLDKPLSNKLECGYLHFGYENDKLYSTVVYEAREELSTTELEALKVYTSGQLSDGIGEGFEQEPCYWANRPYHTYTQEELDEYEDLNNDDLEVFISPWFHGQVLEVYQGEV